MLARYCAMVVSVRPSVCRPSQAGVLSKRRNTRSPKQLHATAPGFYSCTKNLGEFPIRSPATGAPNTGVVGQVGDFRPISRYISETVQDTHTVGTKG